VALDDWVARGTAPEGVRADRSDGALHHDELENLVGGMRSPLVDVPIAKYYANEPPEGTDPCGEAGRTPLIGSTRMLTGEELAARYGSADAYDAEFSASIDEAIANGWVLPEHAEELRRRLVDSAAWVAAALEG
jgi:hypothetical protein